MPAYPATLDEFMGVMAPYYQSKRPADLLFEFFVVDVLAALPEATERSISSFAAKLPAFFESAGGDWRRWVRETFRLSGTIEIAILDLWLRNSARAREDGWKYHPWHYARNFVEKYSEEGSEVDVWSGDALEQAKARIAAYRGG
jgi:hypothetical protein